MSRTKLTANNYCHQAVKGGEAVEHLIDRAASGQLDQYLAEGNSINVVADKGMSALHALARSKSGTRRDKIALRALLEAGINVDLVTDRNETALFRALVTRSSWMWEPLLSAGASLDVTNSSGVSLLSMVKPEDRLIHAFASAKELEQGTAPARARPGSSRRRSL